MTKLVNRIGLYALIFASIAVSGIARADEESDVIRAQAYISLGDELYQMAQEDSDSLTASLTRQGVTVPINSSGFAYTSAQQKLLTDYSALAAQAAGWYEKVFGKDYDLATGETFDLPIGYAFLKRDAFEKWTSLKNGFLFGAYRRRNANLYAVNADFKNDIVAKTSAIVSELQRLDVEARRIQHEYNALRTSESDASGNVVGVQASELQAQNYSVNLQTQIQQYQGQSRSLQAQLADEAKALKAKAAVVEAGRKMLRTNWANLLDVDASNGGAPQVISVSATSNSYMPAATLSAGQVIYIQASGRWKANGAADSGCYGGSAFCYEPFVGVSNPSRFYYYTNVTFLDPAAATTVSSYPSLKLGSSALSPVFQAMHDGNLDSDANGIYISTSDSTGYSESDGEAGGVSGGLSAYGISIGGSYSESFSKGYSRGKGQSVTIGLRSANADLPSANLGALIGAFVGNGLTDEQRQPFVVGINNAIQVPTNATGPVTLYLMQNDVQNHHAGNFGTMSVQVTTSTSFAAYTIAFFYWFTQGCLPVSQGQPQNCGFKGIVDNLAFETNPQQIAQAALVNVFNAYPANLQPVPKLFEELLSGAVNSSLSLAMANRDYDLALLQFEQSQIAMDTAEAALDTANQSVAITHDLASMIQKQTISKQTTSALIATAAQFYEDELANMEHLRSFVIARLKRYMQITYDSFNYRYLSDLKMQGSPQPGYEGDYYSQSLQALLDRASDDDVNNDVSNPNRGYLVYDLPAQQLANLKAGKSAYFRLSPDLFYCQGYGIEDQVRFHVEKVGYLLDVDPINEQSFFKNPNIRRVALRTTHGNANLNFDLNTSGVEYYLPSQTKAIYGYSSRVLTDYHSDFSELGDSNLFQRRSFQNTSFISDWSVELLDTENYDLTYLNGLKFVVYFSSVEAANNAALKVCTSGPTGSVRRGYWK